VRACVPPGYMLSLQIPAVRRSDMPAVTRIFNSSAADRAIDLCSVLACCNHSHLQENRVGFVVRASVFGWRTFADLCLIYGRHVITPWVVSAMGQPTSPTQPSIPSGKRAVIHIITWITG